MLEDDGSEGGKDIFGEEEGEQEVDEPEEDEDDAENDVFALARENKELTYANSDMMDKIDKIEDEMLDQKKWQMKGEVECKDRQYNGLLEEYLDFDTATKLPP